MNCCGEERATPFCPECGKNLKGALGGLLEHIERYVSVVEKRMEAMAEKPGDKSVRHRRWLKRDHATVLKWTGWRDALKELMETQKA